MTALLSALRSKWFWIGIATLAVLAVVIFLNSTSTKAIIEKLTPPDLPRVERPANRVALAQNWTPQVAGKFHHISQGTSTLPVPYEWLIALEQAESSPWGLLIPGSKGLFMDGPNMERYGFISAKSASPDNPDQLPYGFAWTPQQNLPGYPMLATTVGFTCAACHTGRFTHDGTEYIVNGGPATIDLGEFTKGLSAAIGQTLLAAKLPTPNKRFDRFAKRVLQERYSASAKQRLSSEMQSIVQALASVGDIIDVTEGFGRLDAVNRIGNQVFSKNTGRRDNYIPINAPVNYPHIWTASWFNWVQYDGSIMQPLIRNAGEALGVHTNIDTTAPIDSGRFSSSLPIRALDWIEDEIAGPDHPTKTRSFGGLQGPKWPQDTLGQIDTALAAQGQTLYVQNCQGCHLPPVDSAEIFDKHFKKIRWYDRNGRLQETADTYLRVKTIGLDEIGTDPAQAAILNSRTVNTAKMPGTSFDNMGINAEVCGLGYRPQGTMDDAATPPRSNKALVSVDIGDGPMLNFGLALGAIVQQANDKWFENNNIPEDKRAGFEGDRPNCLRPGRGYKARPLNGVWATGPFLHNGSVPTLDDLLRPADQRPRYVQLGGLAFDPIKVGVLQPELDRESYPEYVEGTFIVDTILPGNRNTGHAFGTSADGDKTGVIGPQFTDQQRAALIEYLKGL